MNRTTRQQLHALSLAFYEAHAEAFDASRVDLPWPGWEEVLRRLPDRRVSVLDIGCGNGRFARYLREVAARSEAPSPFEFDYLGTDANALLLEAARTRLGADHDGRCEWRLHDFLASREPGDDLPIGPFSLVALMGVLHHVPGRETRRELLRSAAKRVARGGLLVFTTWQFAEHARFDRRRVEWSSLGPVLGQPIDLSLLEPGDQLLRFGDDPAAPPRYCHQVSDEEFESWATDLDLDLEWVSVFRADGAQGNLNRYGILKRV